MTKKDDDFLKKKLEESIDKKLVSIPNFKYPKNKKEFLMWCEGMTYDEIADETGKSRNYIKKMCSEQKWKDLNKLKKKISSDMVDEAKNIASEYYSRKILKISKTVDLLIDSSLANAAVISEKTINIVKKSKEGREVKTSEITNLSKNIAMISKAVGEISKVVSTDMQTEIKQALKREVKRAKKLLEDRSK